MAIDPVCGMQIDEQKAVASAEHQGTTFYFCSSGCQQKFIADPARYAKPADVPPSGGLGPGSGK